MATKETNSIGSTDPRVAAILEEIASLAQTAWETMESADLSAGAAAGLQLMRQIGYLADSGVKITGGIQTCGGAADWFARFLREDEAEVAHG